MKHRDIFAFMLGSISGAIVAYTYFSSKYATDKDVKKGKTKNNTSKSQTSSEGPLRASEGKLETPKNEANEPVDSPKGESMGFIDESEVPEEVKNGKHHVGLSSLSEYMKQTTDYTSYSKDEGRPDIPAPPVPNSSPVLTSNEKPMIISADEYEDGLDKYEHSALLYFVDSYTLTTDQEEIVDDPLRMIGDVLYDLPSCEGTVIFVRNPVLGIDYDITKMAGKYE